MIFIKKRRKKAKTVAAPSKAQISHDVNPLPVVAARIAPTTGKAKKECKLEKFIKTIKQKDFGYAKLRVEKGPAIWSEKKQKTVRRKFLISGATRFGELGTLIAYAGEPDDNGVHSLTLAAGSMGLTKSAVYTWTRRKLIPKRAALELVGASNGRVPIAAFKPYIAA